MAKEKVNHSRLLKRAYCIEFTEAIREELGLTQEEFAQKLGVSWGTVARWEAGKSKPSKLAQKAIENFIKGGKACET